jgi:hypothetical protein
MKNFFPEGGFSRKIDNKIDKGRLIESAHLKAKSLIEKYSIKEEGFRDIYSDDVIDNDLTEVARIERLVSQEKDENVAENNKLSEIFNAIILEQFEKSDWMGPNAFTIGTSKYDRFRTGIGNVTEFHEERGISYLAMAVRVTFSPNLEKKLLKIKDDIKDGELSKIKYFESDLHRGELKKVPNVIVGCDKEMLLEVVELWVQNKNKALGEHPLQFLILDQAKKEINYFRDEALSHGKHELVEIYESVLNNIDGILKGKNDLRKKLENPENDNSLTFKENHDRVMLSLEGKLKEVFGK